MGDFNVEVGADTGGLKQVKGKHGLGPRSQHANILVKWCTLDMVEAHVVPTQRHW
jgi:hypothetical protein